MSSRCHAISQVNKYIYYGELANIVFKTATDGSYSKTWYLPTKHSNIHKTKGTSKLACCLMVCDTS